jgi:hypothetical protein
LHSGRETESNAERPNIRLALSATDLKWNVAAIAAKIAADHKDTQDDPIVLLIVLNGAFMFGADPARALHARNVSCGSTSYLLRATKAGNHPKGYRYFKCPKQTSQGVESLTEPDSGKLLGPIRASADQITRCESSTDYWRCLGLQCGYSTPGLMLSTYQLLSTPTEKEIRKGIAGNTCRCTRYQSVLKAIELAVQSMK